MDTLELIALLSSRLCHDLVGPVGAVVNGLEILADEPDPDLRRRAIAPRVLNKEVLRQASVGLGLFVGEGGGGSRRPSRYH